MRGKAVPLVLIPRYTSYVGEGEYTTVPLEVSEYAKAYVTLWRGQILRSWETTHVRTFRATFQGSHDAEEWVNLGSEVTTVDTVDDHEIELTRRWFRVRILLSKGGDPTDDAVGITCWATGLLERRIED